MNVLVRSHYLPLFSRLGPYDRALLDRFAYEDHEVFEYWAHEASLVRVDLQPLPALADGSEHRWPGMRRGACERRPEEARRPRTPRSSPTARSAPATSTAPTGKKGPWWGWGDTKRGLEHLFYVGPRRRGAAGEHVRARLLRSRARGPRVVPAAPTPDPHDALAGLLEQAARTYGVATAKDLSDFFRLSHQGSPAASSRRWPTRACCAACRSRGGRQPAFLHPAATLPRAIDACALVSPFDPVMWERERVERLFGFSYRIEIYVPKPKRTYGYYVMPFLLGDRYVARVDLKADRAASTLLVQAAWAEQGADKAERGRAPRRRAAHHGRLARARRRRRRQARRPRARGQSGAGLIRPAFWRR